MGSGDMWNRSQGLVTHPRSSTWQDTNPQQLHEKQYHLRITWSTNFDDSRVAVGWSCWSIQGCKAHVITIYIDVLPQKHIWKKIEKSHQPRQTSKPLKKRGFQTGQLLLLRKLTYPKMLVGRLFSFWNGPFFRWHWFLFPKPGLENPGLSPHPHPFWEPKNAPRDARKHRRAARSTAVLCNGAPVANSRRRGHTPQAEVENKNGQWLLGRKSQWSFFGKKSPAQWFCIIFRCFSSCQVNVIISVVGKWPRKRKINLFLILEQHISTACHNYFESQKYHSIRNLEDESSLTWIRPRFHWFKATSTLRMHSILSNPCCPFPSDLEEDLVANQWAVHLSV